MFRLASALVCLLLPAAAQGQVTTSNVHVRINGPDCGKLQDVFLIMDDEDNGWIKLNKAPGDCEWEKKLGQDRSFLTSHSHFSLRYDSGRTDCRQAAPNKNEKDLVGELEFNCCSGDPLRNLRVTTDPRMPISYVRHVGRDRQAPRSIDCNEGGIFDKGTGPISYVQFSDENVYIEFGTPAPKLRLQGLSLNAVVAGGDTVVLQRNGVVYRLAVQRAKAKTKTGMPTFSSNAISIDVKKLGDLKLDHVEIIGIP